jgi:hypothetical protein
MKHFRLVQKSKVLVGDILYSDYKELCTFVAENKEEALEKTILRRIWRPRKF